MNKKSITIENGGVPLFSGDWTVGEVLLAAQQLAAWVEQLRVTTSPSISPLQDAGQEEPAEHQ